MSKLGKHSLLFIANQEAGSFLTSLETVENLLEEYEIDYQLEAVDTLKGAKRAAGKADPAQHRAVAVFGGDSTIIAVAKQIISTKLPLLILPGGSANSIAKELGLPRSLEKIIKYYASGAYVVRRAQLGACNGQLMLLDAHFGVFAGALEQTPRLLKSRLGAAAYAITIARQLLRSESHHYRLELDGRIVEASGYVCFIVNYGRPRLLGQSVLPKARDGYLRVAIVREAHLPRIFLWYFKRLIGRSQSRTVISRRAETVTVEKAGGDYAFDDQAATPKLPLKFEVSNQTLSVIVPAPAQHSWRSYLKVVQMTYYRLLDHTRRQLSGAVSLRYSRVGRHLYLGGQYGDRSLHLFRGWGVKGIVSMREFIPKPIEGVEILHLPTVDHTAPTLENLNKGVVFIQEKLSNNQAVYIHCHLGEGRGPTMAAAYLISEGMRPQDAILHLQRTRPHARPNKKQTAQLMKFAEQRSKN